MIKPGNLLPVHIVAIQLNCTPRHVRNLIYQGKLEAVRIGGRNYRVLRASVIKFMETSQFDATE